MAANALAAGTKPPPPPTLIQTNPLADIRETSTTSASKDSGKVKANVESHEETSTMTKGSASKARLTWNNYPI